MNNDQQNNINMSGENNPYKDYLPENRFKEKNGFSTKTMKFGLFGFYAIVAVLLVVIGLRFRGIDLLEVESRNYNLNLTETINLDTIYASPDVVWETTSENVKIENNVVTAIKSGDAYIVGRIGNKQVSDVVITILGDDTSMYLEDHSLEMNVGENQQITIVENNTIDEPSYETAYESNNQSDDYDDNENEDNIIYNNFGPNDENEFDEIIDDSTSSIDPAPSIDSVDSNEIINEYSYESSDEEVAKVDDNGTVEPVGPGTAVITVTDGENIDYTYVTVVEDKLSITKEYKIHVKESTQIKYELTSSKYSTNDINWKSDNTNIVEVDSNGKITAKAVGSANIIATVGDIVENVKVIIENNTILPTAISLSAETLTLTEGENKTVVANVIPSNATDKSISWISKNDNIATVNNGVIVGKSAGNTIITAITRNGISKTINVQINKKVVAVTGVSFEKSTISIKNGSSTSLKYSLAPSNATDKTIKINYDKNYLQINSNSKSQTINIKAIKSGTTSLNIVTSNNKSAAINIAISKSDAEIAAEAAARDKARAEADQKRVDELKKEQKKKAEEEEAKRKAAEKAADEARKKRKIKDGDIIGATGFAALNKKEYLYKSAKTSSKKILTLEQNVPFKILGEKKINDITWWYIDYKGKNGYVKSEYCLINLPDYIPSITYNISNASSSIYMSSGQKLSKITGKQLYKTSKVYNERLERNEYIVPLVYSFGKKILKAQKKALNEGYSLKIYDAYRPKSVADDVKRSLDRLYNSNSKVKNNINKGGWGRNWFIAQNLSAHSVASAIDVTLTKNGKEVKMPSNMHELSVAAVKYTTPISGQTTVRSSLYKGTMTTGAKDLDRIMLSTGMTSLASEWWHFQDNTAKNRIKAYESSGLNFQPTKIVSSK